jgi:ABC-2 type transport system ATP-binding protein
VAERVIEIVGLHKSYGDVEAVAGIDLYVDRGEVFALLGPNGAGKTTTTEILEGFLAPTAGSTSVLGHDPAKGEQDLKRRIGIVLQSTGVDKFLTVRETIEMYGGYYPRQRPTEEVIEVVGLSEKTDARVRQLSGGQQRRLDVAIALAGDPELLFLDEPTTGFDPSARRNAWEMVKNLVSIGKTVWLTTHFMDEAQYLADRVAVLAKGSIVAEGTPDSIAGRDQMRTTVRFRPPADAPTPPAWGQVPTGDGGFVIEAEDATRVVHDLTGWAIEHNVALELLEDGGGAGAMSQVLRQIRFTNKAFWRNPASAFFTFVFPLLFLVIFTTLLGNDDVSLGTTTIKLSTFYVFSMAAFGLISACYTNIAISVVFAREEGVLKRVRGTPMPASAYLTARVIHAALVGFLLVAITVVFGVVAYQAHFPSGLDVLYFVISLVIGAGCFASIGLAISGLVPNADAGPPIINAVILPLLFLSGVFIAIGPDAPAWVLWLGRIFPVRHLVQAMQYSYLGLPFHWSDIAVMAVWMIGAIVVATRTFRWEPGR